MRLLDITESKCGVPQHFLAPVNSWMMVSGEEKGRKNMKERKEAEWNSISSLSGFIYSEVPIPVLERVCNLRVDQSL